MPTPIIGLTGFRQRTPDGSRLAVNETYPSAVQRAGGAPLLIPLDLDAAGLDAVLARLDGILFTGGGDIQPEVYGSRPHPLVEDVDAERDRVELHCCRGAVKTGLPLLGICRGLQVLNVALGGTLYEDIQAQRPGALRHRFSAGYRRDHPAHPVTIDASSRLFSIVGKTTLTVNSIHHQGIDRLADALTVAAAAPDGLIEAVELNTHPFAIAVQWHPECLPDDEAMQALFRAFVQACATA